VGGSKHRGPMRGFYVSTSCHPLDTNDTQGITYLTSFSFVPPATSQHALSPHRKSSSLPPFPFIPSARSISISSHIA